MVSEHTTTNFYFKFCLLLTLFSYQFALKPCKEFLLGECIKCPVGSHLFQRLCYDNIIGCLSYASGSLCTSCDPSISTRQGSSCKLIPGLTQSDINDLKFRTTIGDQYGSPSFVQITISEALLNENFQRCDSFMRRSEYSYHISPVSNPLISVHSFIVDRTQHFKILYEGSGGGLFLCIIEINIDTDNVILSSFVAIGKSTIKDNCVDYDSNGKCQGCEATYHLQKQICYKNIGSCISQIKNICVECYGFNILIENRCQSRCSLVSDTNSDIFYFNTVSENAILNQIGILVNNSIPLSSTQTNVKSSIDPYCSVFDANNVCTQCSFRFFKNSLQICETVDPLCNNFNKDNGKCTSCFPSYELVNGSCIAPRY